MMIFLAVLFIYNYMPAQVTIGTLEDPQEGALLDLKENNKAVRNEPNSTKGLLFPKVSLVSSVSLSPLFTATEEPQKTSSTGMIVYNVNENADGIKSGLCIWNGDEWTSIEGGGSSGAANFEIDCKSSIKVKGVLSKGKSLSPTQNIITLPIIIKKEGKYSIQAYTENGYYFVATGEFLRKGKYDVILMGMGSPVDAQTDTLSFHSNGTLLDMETLCPGFKKLTLTVNDISPDFFIIQPVDATGADLKVNEAGTGYMTVRIQASSEAVGADYHIETDVQDGIKFEGKGKLTAGTQTVTLVCNGNKPTKMGILTFQIMSNSIDTRNGLITVDASVTGRKVNVWVFCPTDVNDGWHIVTDRSVGMLLNNQILFGPNSKYCPIEGINVTQKTGNGTTDFTAADVIILSFPVEPDDNMVDSLINFVNKGGALIHSFQENNNPQPLRLLNTILGTTNVTRTVFDNRIINITGVDGDSIVKNGGYLSNLAGKTFGCDGGGNSSFNPLPPGIVDVLATTKSGEPVILKSKTKTYLVIGDGSPFNGGTSIYTNGSLDFRPMQVTTDGYPSIRTTGVYAEGTYNAHLFVNAMIWAIKRRLAVEP